MMFGKSLLNAALLGLLVVGAGCSNPTEDRDHREAVDVYITDLAAAPLAIYSTSSGQWTFPTSDALEVPVGGTREVRIFFVAPDGDQFQVPASGDVYTYRVVVQNEAIVEFYAEDDHGYFEGASVGQTTARVELVHGGHADFATNPGMPVRVVNAP